MRRSETRTDWCAPFTRFDFRMAKELPGGFEAIAGLEAMLPVDVKPQSVDVERPDSRVVGDAQRGDDLWGTRAHGGNARRAAPVTSMG